MVKASEIMTTNVIKISGVATVDQAVKLMKDNGIRSFIVDRRHEQDAYGIVTESDIVSKVIAYGKNPQEVRVYEIMTKPCIAINPELGVEYVARLFANMKIHVAPVIQNELLGIISLSDIIHKSDFLENPKSVSLKEEIDEAIKNAREFCENSDSPQECIIVWKKVEELEAEAAHQQEKTLPKTALEKYCEEFPELKEMKLMLDNWCSG